MLHGPKPKTNGKVGPVRVRIVFFLLHFFLYARTNERTHGRTDASFIALITWADSFGIHIFKNE